jgi:DNA repair protein RadC
MRYDKRDGRFVQRLGNPFSVFDAPSVAGYIMENIFPKPETYMQEEMWALLFNCRDQITYEVLVSRGSLTESHAHPSMIFRDAIWLGAHRVIITHNHPSGNPDPSHADVELTQRLRNAGELLGIPMLDHIIVAKDAWYSMAENHWCSSHARP